MIDLNSRLFYECVHMHFYKIVDYDVKLQSKFFSVL